MISKRSFIGGIGASLSIPLAPWTLAEASRSTGRRLILVELSGANDGLNTLVPFGHDRYYNLRPNIALDRSDLILINDWQGLHGSLSPLLPCWQDGDLAVVQGLGYPGQSRSHFKSIALWESGGDGNRAGRTGWLTDDVLSLNQSDLDVHGISLDGGMGVFAASDGTWISLTSLSQLTELSSSNRTFEFNGTASDNSALGELLSRANSLDTAMSNISAKLAQAKPTVNANIGGGDLGRQMGLALHLIAHNIETPVLKVQISGFDTHEYQNGRHSRKLRDLGQALAGLRRGLKSLAQWDQTLVMTYSEFGRRAEENNSQGTDHGTAAPHFVMGGRVRGGLWGQHPDLDNLRDGDIQYTMDYRSLYERVLSDWFGLQTNRFLSARESALSGLLI